MKRILDLTLGYTDAENYKRRENKTLFSQLFLKTDALDQICSPTTSFLIGEKGTGKTAFAVYIGNIEYKNNRAAVRYIRETEYQKFIALKKEKQLTLSDYTQIWRVIIYLLVAEQIRETVRTTAGFFGRFAKFKKIADAIDDYYNRAFAPEILYALQFIEKSKLAAELIAKHAKAGGEISSEANFSESRFQTNLLYIAKQFEDALSSLKLEKNEIVFIDGIDIRPASIPYDEYVDCIKGLANAVWAVNNDLFASIRDSKGRLRVVLLIRPDIFQSLGLQNQNTKIRDNSVLLDWRSTYHDHRSSNLFLASDRLLSAQQEVEMRVGGAWDYYFPFDSPNIDEKFAGPSSFIGFMRLSYYRPRDIVTMLKILQENIRDAGLAEKMHFTFSDTETPEFRNKYGEYLLGEIKDQVLFYYSHKEYEQFLKFFEFLNGRVQFDYEFFSDAFARFREFAKSVRTPLPPFMSTENDFLQFLYDLNVIMYVDDAEDGEQFFRWCFRERSYSNISPKVKAHVRYGIHYGMARAVNVGRRLIARKGGTGGRRSPSQER